MRAVMSHKGRAEVIKFFIYHNSSGQPHYLSQMTNFFKANDLGASWYRVVCCMGVHAF